jgi:hypothetical protein
VKQSSGASHSVVARKISSIVASAALRFGLEWGSQ